ncbi:glycosyltransferase involved in cell wall biosynthesis [Dyadobacter jejuensis]|uniref:Glycosyltransferase involved in cell wall biosynthesis n=2 Tax=Dyadobacter jejuensis TaxID=1082580 RepID=A0A316AKS6_9BACT|nr:glycosyltransferase involved in cell wall biosynthesis [Dyadobacter jejuensis]
MHILHIVYSLVPGQYFGGVPKMAFELACAQARLGHRVSIYTTNINGPHHFPLPSTPLRVHFGPIEVYYFPAQKYGVFFSNSLRHYLHQYGATFDAIHTHNTYHPLNQYARQTAARQAIPLFYHTHGCFNPISLHQGFWKAIKKRLYLQLWEYPGLRRATGIFVNTEAEQQEIKKRIPQATVYELANGVAPPPRQCSKTSGPIVLVTLSRIHPCKGLHYLIEALHKLPQDHLCLKIIGDFQQDRAYTHRLQERIRAWGLTDKIKFLGHLNEPQKYEQLCNADIYCQFSESEGTSLSILEAMSVGLCCVVSEGCSMHQAATHHALLACKNGDIQDIVERLLLVVQNSEYRRSMGIKAQQYILQHHGWDRLAAKVMAHYPHNSNH